MSHFCVLVISDEKPAGDDLSKILAPWDGSDYNDHAHQFIDKHDQLTEEWQTQTMRGYRSPDGKEYRANDKVFEKVTTSNEPRKLLHRLIVKYLGVADTTISQTTYVVPDDYEEIEIPIKTLFPSVEAYARDWYGYEDLKDGRIGYIDNPVGKWDWWQIGGRFSNMFSEGQVEDNPQNWEQCDLCRGTGMRNDEIGREARKSDPDYMCNGCQGKGTRLKWPTAWVNEGTQSRIGDINGDAVKSRRVSCYALIMDGVWYERGEPGWWSDSSSEYSDEKWDKEFEKLIAALPVDNWITVVDCHY